MFIMKSTSSLLSDECAPVNSAFMVKRRAETHETFDLLMSTAGAMGLKTKKALAEVFDESPANINNWRTRGVPEAKKALASVFFNIPLELLQPEGFEAMSVRAAKLMGSPPAESLFPSLPATPPSLEQALAVVLAALAKAPARSELRQLLPMLVDTNASAYQRRLLELLTEGTTNASLVNPAAPEHQADLNQMSHEAEQLDAGKTKRRRSSRG